MYYFLTFMGYAAVALVTRSRRPASTQVVSWHKLSMNWPTPAKRVKLKVYNSILVTIQ